MHTARFSRLRAALRPLAIIALALTHHATTQAQDAPAEPPFPLIPARAWHVNPETTSEESGYFSLCIGHDGTVYVGTAKYNENAYLVAFDPKNDHAQRIVIDTHATFGLTDTGYAAQSKIHTRNDVGRQTGIIYVGSKQGYRKKGDTSEYPGGYVMAYDPRINGVYTYGMPRPTLGVIDVVADETHHAKLYVVTCETEYWLVADLPEPPGGLAGPDDYRRIGEDIDLELYDYATTLVDSRGVASSITADFQLVQYDPATGDVTVRPITLPDGTVVGQPAGHEHRNAAIPTWRLAADGRTAYLIRMSEPTLFAIDLLSPAADHAAARDLGRFLPTDKTDCRASLDIAPDGRVFAMLRAKNDTGWGHPSNQVHHICAYDPATDQITDYGVLVAENPDFADFTKDDKGKHIHKYHHGFVDLPNGMLAPRYAHMGLVVTADNSLYVTQLYPYTLMYIPADRVPRREANAD